MKQETNIKINIGDKKQKRKYVRRRPKKESQSQNQPNIITITNPPAVSTIHTLPIYYQETPYKHQETPFLANTPTTTPPVINQPVIRGEVDRTQLSGQVPASFIPQEAPELIRTGGSVLDITRRYPEVSGGAILTEVEAVAVRPRKQYTFKPETIARREQQRKNREDLGIPSQNTPPSPEYSLRLTDIVPTGMSNTEFLNKNRRALEEYSNKAQQARVQQEGVLTEMRIREANVRNRTIRNRQLSQTPSAIYQRERRQKLKSGN